MSGTEERIRKLRSLDELGRYEYFLELYRSRSRDDRRALSETLSGRDPLLKLMLLQYLEEIPESRAVARIVPLLEDENAAVRETAQRAYSRSHYPRKNRHLRGYVRSRRPAAACFAIRTLSRLGDMDILPPVLTLLSAAEESVCLEALDALRFLHDPRSIPHLRLFADSGSEPARYRSIRALGELASEGIHVPLDTFLERVQDDSSRVRRAAMRGLSTFPSKRISGIFLERALSPKEHMESRRRALQGLASYPHRDWVRPLVELMVHEPRGPLRLSTEITLKRFPGDVLREGLFPLMDHPEDEVRQRTALILAEVMGEEPDVRARLLRYWESAKDPSSRLTALEVLGEMGGPDLIPILLGVLKESPLMAYTAVGVLGRLWSSESGPQIMRLLKTEELPQFAKQALLSSLLRRGIDDSIRAELLPWLLRGLQDEVMNIRYLSLQLLGEYPREDTFGPILGLLAREKDDEVLRTARQILLRGLGGNPIPLVAETQKSPDAGRLRPQLVRILRKRRWDEDRVFDLLYGLMLPPLSLPEKDPGSFLSLAVSMLENGSMTLEKVWLFAPSDEHRRILVEQLRDAMRDPVRRFPPLPLEFLAFHLADKDEATRGLFCEVVGLSRQAEGIALLTAALLRESDAGVLARGRESLRRLVRSAVAPVRVAGPRKPFL